MVSHDPYEILGIEEGATKEEITEAYEELIEECYLNRGTQLAQIDKAYKLLCGVEDEMLEDLSSEPEESALVLEESALVLAESPPISRKRTSWIQSHRIRIALLIGGSMLLGFAAYKTIQLGKTLNKRALQTAGLIGADYMVSQSTQTIGFQLTAEQLASQVLKSPTAILKDPLTPSTVLNACKWVTGPTGSFMQWTVGKLSPLDADGESCTAIASAVSSVSSGETITMLASQVLKSPTAILKEPLTPSTVLNACKWETGPTGAFMQWTVGKLSPLDADGESCTAIASAVSSVSSGEKITMIAPSDTEVSNQSEDLFLKAWKWTADSTISACQWTSGKLSSRKEDGESTIAATVSSVSSSVSKALKWTAGSTVSAWQWSANKLSPPKSDSSVASSVVASSVGGISRAWKWATGSGASAESTASSTVVGTITKSSIGALSKVWQWTTGKASTPSGTETSSIVSTSGATNALSKLWKWTTGQG